jgi:lipopolysaccharide transport system permease protein
MIRSLWTYRYFMLSMIRNDLNGRMARSYVGAGWFFLQPMAFALIFALVLSEGLGARLPRTDSKYAYALFVLSGMAAWGLFSEIVNRCLTVFIEYGPTLKKIAFPRLCLPIIVLGNALVSQAMLLLAIFVLMLALGHLPGLAWLVIIPGMVLLAGLAFGLGLILGVFNVYSRDVGQVSGVFLQMWFWLTPIAYPLEAVPAAVKPIVEANPLTPVIAIYQDALVRYQSPDADPLFFSAVLVLALMTIGLILFWRASPEMVDAL